MDRRRDHTRLNIWVTFAGTVLAALIGGVFALIATGREEPQATATTRPPQPAQRTTAVTSPTASRPTAGAPPTGDAEPGTPVRWSGRVVATGRRGLSDAVDLDQKPPRSLDDTAGDADLSIRRLDAGEFDLAKAALGRAAFFAVWDGEGTPGFEQCQDAALAQGTADIAGVEATTVICVRTNEDRVARLTVAKISTRQETVTFDAVIWDND